MKYQKFFMFLTGTLFMFQGTQSWGQSARNREAVMGLGLGVEARLSIDEAYASPQGTIGSGAHFMVRHLGTIPDGSRDHFLYNVQVDTRYNVFTYNDRGLGTAAGARVEALIIGTMSPINETGCNFYGGLHLYGSVNGGYMQTRPLQTGAFAAVETGVLCRTNRGSYFTISPTVGAANLFQTQRAAGTTPRGAGSGYPLLMGGTLRYITEENMSLTINAMLLPMETSNSGRAHLITADFTRVLGDDWALNLQTILTHYEVQTPSLGSRSPTQPRRTYDIFGGLTFIRLF